MPFQRSIFAGSVKNGNIVSGRATMRTSRSTTSVCAGITALRPPFLGLGFDLQQEQVVVPEAFEIGPELAKAFRPRPIHAPGPFTSLGDEAGSFQHVQVLRD